MNPRQVATKYSAQWQVYKRDNGGVPKHYWPDSPLRETARRLGKGELPQDLCSDTCVLRVGKKAAGRLLDGVEHNEFPKVK